MFCFNYCSFCAVQIFTEHEAEYETFLRTMKRFSTLRLPRSSTHALRIDFSDVDTMHVTVKVVSNSGICSSDCPKLYALLEEPVTIFSVFYEIRQRITEYCPKPD